MANMNFNTENKTFGGLMGNGLTYRVPQFQRDYSWSDEYWDDLWQDMSGLFGEDAEPVHYMGYLVLQSGNPREFDVIDGQQRITTLSVLVLAVLSILKEMADSGDNTEDNTQRAKQLRDHYIGYLDPVTLIPHSKLELNRNNNGFYQTYLVPLERIPQRNIKSSERLLGRAFRWFREKLAQSLRTDDHGRELAEFVEMISTRLLFTVITVTDELNAFKVFETLNARGVRLSSTDLLKNYLFSVVHADGSHETEMQELETRWERVVGNLGGEKFPEFLRVFWNSKNKLVRKTALFKAMKTDIQNKEQVFDLVRALDGDANTYAALRNPNDELWTDKELRARVRELRMFSVKQPLSLLLAAYRRFPPGEDTRNTFAGVLKAISVLSFRYNVICSLHPGEQESVYNQVALGISKGTLTNISGIRSELRRIYPDDKKFQAAFAEKSFATISRNKSVIRYILSKWESHLTRMDIDPESSNITLEHIFPENPGEGWDEFSDPQNERFKYFLGNFTFLDGGANRDIGNGPYEAKRDTYAESAYAITNTIPQEAEDWTPETIQARQEKMAKAATVIWRFSE